MKNIKELNEDIDEGNYEDKLAAYRSLGWPKFSNIDDSFNEDFEKEYNKYWSIRKYNGSFKDSSLFIISMIEPSYMKINNGYDEEICREIRLRLYRLFGFSKESLKDDLDEIRKEAEQYWFIRNEDCSLKPDELPEIEKIKLELEELKRRLPWATQH